MQITVVEDPNLVEAVQENLDNSPYKGYVEHVVNDILKGKVAYLWGGAVRDPIVHLRYGIELPTNDFDILVDDSDGKLDVGKLFEGEVDVFFNRFGTVKWRPVNNLEIDVSSFNNANSIKAGLGVDPTLDAMLTSCDFTTGSIAYGLQDRKIYDFKALAGIQAKEIELVYEADEPHILMARLVLHSDKLKFTIGERGMEFIRQSYTPELDRHIARYLTYKEKSDKTPRVTDRLKEIAGSQDL